MIIVVQFRFRMSNWRVFSESQDEELQPEAGFELSLSQLPDQPLVPRDLVRLHERPEDEAGPSRLLKQPCVERRWHGNLHEEARALVILLQVGCVEPGSCKVTFEGSFEGLNRDKYFGMVKPIKAS